MLTDQPARAKVSYVGKGVVNVCRKSGGCGGSGDEKKISFSFKIADISAPGMKVNEKYNIVVCRTGK